MIEIRVHGRGGQGGVTLAKLVATTRFLQGDAVQAFGLYAAERTGAPLQAFCRYDAEPIATRNLIYEPDHVVVLDPTLIGPAIAAGLVAGGWILINTPEPPAAFRDAFPRHRVATVDATGIARRHGLGTRSVPIVNTALAGAVGRMLGFGLEPVLAALAHLGFGGGNVAAAQEAYDGLATLDLPAGLAAAPPSARAAAPPPLTPSFLDGAGGDLPQVRTGQWATQRPLRQQMVPPCNHVCPAGNDVQGFLQALARDEVDEALRILLETTPFPGVCGRVCPSPCQDNCNRTSLDGAVNVRQLERYAAEHGEVRLGVPPRRPQRVAIVGSGPAGLSAAYHLARQGYGVEVLEAGDELGGLLRTGIPGFRLPAPVVDAEIARIAALGVEMRTRERVDAAGLAALARSHDAVLVATGVQGLRGMDLADGGARGGGAAEAVLQGIDFLERARRGAARLDGEKVVVVGGGNTAIDAARTALRVGASEVQIVYRRTFEEMPAIREEVMEAIDEGIPIEYLTLPVAIHEVDKDGPRFRLTCRAMELGAADGSGRRRPVEIPGSDFDLACDRVVLALGQSPDASLFPAGATVREGERIALDGVATPVFAIGDVATNDGTVAAAIGSGRRAARRIHETLAGEAVVAAEPLHRRPVDRWRDEVVKPDMLRLHLFELVPRHEGTALVPSQRSWNFAEVHAGLADAGEAKRCLSCGVCNECDRCVTWCPEGVLQWDGDRLVFDYTYCKGCGVCASECPRSVVVMNQL